MRVASRAGNPIRRMCTAVAEEAPPGPFSLSDPTMQGVLGAFACTYIAVIRWQFKDKSLAKEVALHKAAKAPAEPIADLSPIVAAVVEAAAPTGAAPVLSARMAPAAAAAGASPTDWNVGETGAWLHGLELGAHAPAFKTHAVDGKLLLTLTEQDLYSVLNVVSPLHRKKITMGTAACKSGRGRGRLPSRPDSARRPPTRAPRTAQLTCPRLQLTCYRLLTWFPLPAVRHFSLAYLPLAACVPPQPSPSCATATSTRKRRPGDANPFIRARELPRGASAGRLRVVVQEIGRSHSALWLERKILVCVSVVVDLRIPQQKKAKKGVGGGGECVGKKKASCAANSVRASRARPPGAPELVQVTDWIHVAWQVGAVAVEDEG